MTPEEWKPFPGYGDFYDVSSWGRLRRVNSEKENRRGKILKGSLDKDGYLRYHLRVGGVSTTFRAHRMVATAFLENPFGLPLVLHGKNGISDNSVDNLRWGSNSENMKDRVRDGTCFESLKTHCPRGHEYTEENTIWNNSEHTHRKCRTCHNLRRRVSNDS